jgi:hypothetical protein
VQIVSPDLLQTEANLCGIVVVDWHVDVVVDGEVGEDPVREIDKIFV